MSYRRKFKEDGIADDLGESKKCPKCGSEMEKWLLCHDPDVWHCRKCGHEEKVK